MQALMLAAGLGRRLGKYTEAMTKCMIKVGGKTLLERSVEALKAAGIHRFVMVVGWESEKLIDYIQNNITGMEFEFVHNPDYATTNNIYSLYLAREQLAADDTILLESDLIYDPSLIKEMVDCGKDNLVAVAKYEHWMDGTVVTINADGTIREFIEKSGFNFRNTVEYYKTVNVYKFSREFLRQEYLPFMEAQIEAYGKNQYYELVLKTLVGLSRTKLNAYVIKDIDWYEVDDAQDLQIANVMFSPEKDKYAKTEKNAGGYWRFPKVHDFSSPSNPYFPPTKMMDQMKFFYEALLTKTPSGMGVQKLLVGKMFGVEEDYLLVGNGTEELIDALGRIVTGKMAVAIPDLNECVRCFRNCTVLPVSTREGDFRLSVKNLCDAAHQADLLAITNPDSLRGDCLAPEDLIRILDVCKAENTTCIVDESFIDFTQSPKECTLLSNELLEKYPNLIVIKSIDKAYGVPGLRLAVIASSDRDLVSKLSQNLPSWNINSCGEYFLQIYSLYKSSYADACGKIVEQRELLQKKLREISFLKVYPSEANYIMCAVTGKFSAKNLASKLLNNYRLLIKDLSSEFGVKGEELIWVAVKDAKENEILYQALKQMDKKSNIL